MREEERRKEKGEKRSGGDDQIKRNKWSGEKVFMPAMWEWV